MVKANRGVDRNGPQEHLKPTKREYDYTQDFRGRGAIGGNVAHGNSPRNTGAILTDTTGPDGR